MDSDFRPYYYLDGTIDNMIVACEKCCFAGTPDDFLHPVSRFTRNKISRLLLPRQRDLNRGPWIRHEFASLIAEWNDASSLKVAHLFLRTAWVARVHNSKEKERLYLREAARRLEEGMECGECRSQHQRVVTSYLIAELHRRMHRKRRSTTWYHRAVEEFSFLSDSEADELTWLSMQIHQQLTTPMESLTPSTGFLVL